MITKYLLNPGQYITSEMPKKSIIFHHTAGNGNARLVVDGWNKDNRGRVGTCFVIGSDGEIIQAFPKETDWGYALGISQPNRIAVEAQAIQIELCSYGYLTKDPAGLFYNAYGKVMPPDQVATLDKPFKGYKYFHKYTQAQLDSLAILVPKLCQRHNIKGHLTAQDFNISADALRGAGGFWTHNSFRTDKTDVYPDPRLLHMFRKGWNILYSS